MTRYLKTNLLGRTALVLAVDCQLELPSFSKSCTDSCIPPDIGISLFCFFLTICYSHKCIVCWECLLRPSCPSGCLNVPSEDSKQCRWKISFAYNVSHISYARTYGYLWHLPNCTHYITQSANSEFGQHAYRNWQSLPYQQYSHLRIWVLISASHNC